MTLIKDWGTFSEGLYFFIGLFLMGLFFYFMFTGNMIGASLFVIIPSVIILIYILGIGIYDAIENIIRGIRG